jgi:two-component system, NarL family, sensor histidine kinase DesK
MADALLTGTQAGPPPAGTAAAERADSGHAPPPGQARMTQAPSRPAAAGVPEPVGASPEAMLDGAMPPSRFSRVSWLFAAIWLVYLAQPVGELWSAHDLLRRYLGLADLVAFAAVFIAAFATARSRRVRVQVLPDRWAVAAVAVAAALAGGGYLTIGRDASGLLIYVGVMAVFLLPTRVGWAVVAAAITASVAVPALVPRWPVDPSFAFQVFVSSLAAWGVAQMMKRNVQLAAARNEITRLALADERNRFARDLHDILGHSLTVVAVKAELAGRLASLDPARAETEIADVERIARQALADVRAAAAGYREVTLAGELASAAVALSAAGIEADLPAGELPELPPLHQELFGWAVREGITNVIRHSGAARCRVRLSAGQIEIADDGTGPAPGPSAGPAPAGPAGGAVGCARAHGLTGLCERAAAAGAVVSTGRSAWGGFRLRVRMA